MVSNNFMEIQIGGGGGSLNLEILRGGGTQAVLEIQVDGGGGSKNHAFCHGGVDFFWNNPLLYSLIVVLITLHISVLPSLLLNNIIHVFMKATCIPTVCVKLVVISD